ncbi:MAG: 50S ribosomal protein L4 [Parcubacteria group bacterium]|nr:50S ribosomal protein L4 [Parcubacteria group bacterium]
MKATLYNSKGEMLEQKDLSQDIFGLALNKDLIYQVYCSLLANQRKPIAYTKDRAEVRGGGKKPWAQKGTGRARHGSIRSPLWKGGGVVFGPRLKNYNLKKKINRKAKQQSLKMIFGQKAKDQEIKLIEKFEFKEGKTKEAYNLLKKIFGKDIRKKILIMLDHKEKNLKIKFRNIPSVEIIDASDVNILHLLNNKFVLLSQEAMANLEKRLS